MAHGTAQFAGLGASTLDVTSSSNAIINWQGFSIDAGEVTRFIQPSASSAVLNRVTGADASSILGQLLSNGRVFLVNPHGIVFGEGAVVDTAGLVASTLGISDADFLAGRYRFDAGPDAGGITNEGRIKSGADGVFLFAPNVENSGVIRTDGGDLVLAAGRTITLTSLDLDGVRVDVQAPEDEALNLGELIAERGAAGVFAGSIRNAGTVEANAVTVDEHGAIRLVAQGDITLEAGGRVAAAGPSGGEVHIESTSGTTWVSGEVSARASSGGGGTIRLLGNRVGLAGAQVDASGPTGGGEVLVGGDESGGGSVPTAQSTYVSSDSTVSADALDDGDGGKVIVFAEGFANVQGRLSARGGPNGGDGGFVETSGLESLEILRTPDTTAANGDGGEWLIDPNDIEIVLGGGNVDIEGTNPFTSTDDSARLGIDLIIAALSGGQTVTVQTTESGFDSQAGAIDLNAPLEIEDTIGTNTLILDAHRVININEPISDAAGGAELNLVLDAGDVDLFNTHGIHFNADVTLRSGSLTTDSDYVHIQNGATMTLDGVHWQENSRHVAISSGNGDAGTLIVQNDASVDATSYINVSQEGGNGTLVIMGGGDVTVARGIGIGDASSSSQGSVTVTGSGSTLTTENNINVGTDGSGALNVQNGGDVRVGRVFIGRITGGRGSVTVTGSGSTLTAENNINVGDEGTGELTIENGGEARTRWFTIADGAGSRGTVTVTGSGSTLITMGTDNEIDIGYEGTGTLNVLDGGRVETLKFDVAESGVGQAVIRGIAADGTRSQVVVSPANGKFSGDLAVNAGLARVGRNADSEGTLRILDGGMLQVLDGDGTYGPIFHLARNKGSVGIVLIDGVGSSLEVIQGAPATAHPRGTDFGASGPQATLGRRGAGTTTISNGGTLRVKGENALLLVSTDRVNAAFPDSDTDSLGQRSVVRIESGGRIEIDGEGSWAYVGLGTGGPTADGTVTVTGAGSVLVLTGAGNRLAVGDDGGRGRLEVHDGGAVRYGELVVGANGTTNLSDAEEEPPAEEPPAEGTAEEAQEEIDAVTTDILPEADVTPVIDETFDPEVAGEQGDEGEAGEDDEEEEDESGEALGVDEGDEEEQEELPMCAA